MTDTPELPPTDDEQPDTSSAFSGPSVSITDEMKSSYLDYAMSVIVSRAIPDLRDGLKPVHRRILYAMHETGNSHDKPYRKSACLLYTSPSPRDYAASRMPSSA